jgi:hypothetical protein
LIETAAGAQFAHEFETNAYFLRFDGARFFERFGGADGIAIFTFASTQFEQMFESIIG